MSENNLQKAKLDKFKAMGIPVPLEKPALNQPVTNVKDPKMLARIQEIKNGAKKSEFNAIISSGTKNNDFKPIPTPQMKSGSSDGQNKVAAPKLENFIPATSSSELALAESLFEDFSAPTRPLTNKSGKRIEESFQADSMGTDFLNDFRARMQAKASSGDFRTAGHASGFGFREQEQVHQGLQLNELNNTIQSVATEVAKKVAAETIKNVLDEYLSQKSVFKESTANTYKKVKDDIVLIEGKYYKLVPVKVVSKK